MTKSACEHTVQSTTDLQNCSPFLKPRPYPKHILSKSFINMYKTGETPIFKVQVGVESLLLKAA